MKLGAKSPHGAVESPYVHALSSHVNGIHQKTKSMRGVGGSKENSCSLLVLGKPVL